MSVLNWFTTTTLSNAVSGAISDYNSTHLTVSAGPIQQSPFIGNYANIIYYDANYGPTRWDATARQTMSQLQPCFDWNSGRRTDNCETTGDGRADFAYLAYNTYYPWDDADYATFVVKHEFGHPLGLDHAPCTTASIMSTGCANFYTYLQDHDTGEINSWY